MSRGLHEWIGKNDDAPIPDRVRLRVFERFSGICPMCSRKLRPGHWDCDHIVALINGGKNREGNLRPLCHVPCHSQKSRVDVAIKSRNARLRKHVAGIRKKARWGYGKNDPLKRKINGTLVRRDVGRSD